MHERVTRFHRLRVTDKDGVRTLRFERNQQSSMLLADPFETDIEYVGYLHATLAVAPHAQRALILGLGGGSLAKRMWRDYPKLVIDAVELDPDVVEVARESFALPDDARLRVFVDDARRFVQTAPDHYDIVVVDVFDDDRVPRPLTTEEFMREVAACMTPGGVVAYNVIGAVTGNVSRPFRSLYRTAGNVWRNRWVFVVKTRELNLGLTENLVLLATDAELDTDGLRARMRDRVGGRVTVAGFEGFADDLWTGPVRSGDVPILTDERRRG